MIGLIYGLSAAVLIGLGWLSRGRLKWKLSTRVLFALLLGLLGGSLLNLVFTRGWISEAQQFTYTGWVELIGYGYVDLLKMLTIPLVMVSLLASLVQLGEKGDPKKMVLTLIGILVVTAGVAALISIGVVEIFNLSSAEIQPTEQISAYSQSLASREVQPIFQLLRSFLPRNIFADMAQQRSSSIIAVLIFSMLLGVATLQAKKSDSKLVEPFVRFILALRRVIVQLTRLIMKFTPFAIWALMTNVAANTSLATLLGMARFLIASYTALLLVLGFHLIVLAVNGYSPLIFLKKAWPVFTFAFTSRSSVATIPLNIEYQHKQLGVDGELAALSASLGSSIGQNGCAGVYPAMLVVMIWNALGVSVGALDVITLLLVIMISSFGVAGIGGGATSASIMVLAAMGLGDHIGLAAVLISIEPVIDMMRTLVNVSDSMLSGLVGGRWLKMNNVAIYRSEEELTPEQAVGN